MRSRAAEAKSDSLHRVLFHRLYFITKYNVLKRKIHRAFGRGILAYAGFGKKQEGFTYEQTGPAKRQPVFI